MPSGLKFENVTGIESRFEIKYTEEELKLKQKVRSDLELQFQHLAISDGTKIHKNQTDIAKQIVEVFKQGSVINTMVISPTQSGKTGIICETIRYFISETNIDYKNIYIITGLSSVEWKQQTKNRLPEKFRKRVFHRNDLTATFYKDIEKKKNVLIILDEIQIATSKNQTIHKVFDELNYMNLTTLLKKDVKFLEITATPNGSIYDLMKWGDKFSHKIIVQPPEQYTSCFKLLEEERVKEYMNLCDDSDSLDNIKELKETIEEFYEEPRFHLIRTKPSELQDVTKDNFKKIFGNDCKIIEFDNESEEIDINNIINKSPEIHTFIFIKEKLRCAKTIENKNLVGVYYERCTIKPEDDVVIQGMLGRATGYNDNGDSIIYTHVESINKYKELIESNFENMTINWVSSSTVMKNKEIKSKNYYNTPDNVKGFKVIEYDNACETSEEKKERIKAQREEREKRKQEKEQIKDEKQKLKEEKQKEKEEKKKLKDQEKEQKKKEKEENKKIKPTKPRAKKTKTDVEDDSNSEIDEEKQTKPTKHRAKKTKTDVEDDSKSEIDEEKQTKPTKPRAKKTKTDVKDDSKSEIDEEKQTKPTKPRAKKTKTDVKDDSKSEIDEEKQEKPIAKIDKDNSKSKEMEEKQEENIKSNDKEEDEEDDKDLVFKRQFKIRVKQALKSHATEYNENTNNILKNALLSEYLKNICTSVYKSETFKELIDENGDPKKWEKDSIVELINDHSDFFTKYSIIDKEELLPVIQRPSEEEEEEIESIPEVKSKRRKLLNLNKKMFE
jgi:hypothetical protein